MSLAYAADGAGYFGVYQFDKIAESGDLGKKNILE